jgi:hypothetical protein
MSPDKELTATGGVDIGNMTPIRGGSPPSRAASDGAASAPFALPTESKRRNKKRWENDFSKIKRKLLVTTQNYLLCIRTAH